jgi:hypothetical protein
MICNRYQILVGCRSITVTALFMSWTVFARSNTGIVGSNPTWGMDVWVRLFSVCILYVGSGLATGWSPVQSHTDCLRVKKLKWNKAFHGLPYAPKWEQQERARAIETRMMKRGRVKWAMHIARLWEKRKTYKFFVANCKGKWQLWRSNCRWEESILKLRLLLCKTERIWVGKVLSTSTNPTAQR